jgi:hypothetical protein
MDFFLSMQPVILILNYGPSTRFSPTGPLHLFLPHIKLAQLAFGSSPASPARPACPFFPPQIKQPLPLNQVSAAAAPRPSSRNLTEATSFPLHSPSPESPPLPVNGTRVSLPPVTESIEADHRLLPSCLPRPLTSPPQPIKRAPRHLPPLSLLPAPGTLMPSYITAASALRR